MALRWSQVIQKPEFLALNPEEQEEARQEYYEYVLKPQVPEAEWGDLKSEFDEAYGPAPTEPAEPSMWERAQTMSVRDIARETLPTPLKGAGERIGGLYANLVRFVDTLGESGDEAAAMQQATAGGRLVGWGTAKFIDLMNQAEEGLQDPDLLKQIKEPDESALERYAQLLEDRSDEIGYEEKATWEGVKDDPFTFPAYALEKGVASLPDMAAAIGAPVPYLMARSYELADERAKNFGQAKPTSDQVLAAVPAATALTYAERIAGKTTLGIGERASTMRRAVASAAAKEAAQEFIEEGSEYAYGTVGTGQYDPWENLDRAFAGAAVGGPVGATLRGGIEAARKIQDVQTQAAQAKGELAQDLDATIPEPRRILAHSHTATMTEREQAIQSEAAAQVDSLEFEIQEPAPTPIQTEVAVPPSVAAHMKATGQEPEGGVKTTGMGAAMAYDPAAVPTELDVAGTTPGAAPAPAQTTATYEGGIDLVTEPEVEEITIEAPPATPITEPDVSSLQRVQQNKKAAKAAARRLVSEGQVEEGSAFRGTTMDELRKIVDTGELVVGKDQEGRPGISAAPIRVGGPFAVYGDGVGYIVPPGVTQDSGRAGEVMVDETINPRELVYVINDQVVTFDDLQAHFAKPAEGTIDYEPTPVPAAPAVTPVETPAPAPVSPTPAATRPKEAPAVRRARRELDKFERAEARQAAKEADKAVQEEQRRYETVMERRRAKATESPVTPAETEVVQPPSGKEIVRGAPRTAQHRAKYKELGGKRNRKTGEWTFRTVDRKRVERIDQVYGDTDVVAEPGTADSFKDYVEARGLKGTKLDRDEMKAIRQQYRASLRGQQPQTQTSPADLTPEGGRVQQAVDRMRYIFQDKFIDLKRAEEVAGPGQRVGPYQAEELFHGRAAARVDDIKTNYVNPVTDILAENDISMQDLNDYVHALHAPEANAVLQRRNPDKENNEALSGMSNEDAAKIVAQWQGNEGMQQAARLIRQMNDATADIIAAEGLEPGDVVQSWRDTYQNYVPLHREGKPQRAGRGKGFAIRGRESKGRVGSEGQVVDVLGHSVMNHARAIVRAEKNRVGQKLLQFAQENPDPNFWRIDPIQTQKTIDPKTGLVTTTSDPSFQTADNVFPVKVNGETRHIVFNEGNPTAMRLASSMKNLDAEQINSVVRVFQSVNRILSALSTTYNPEFMFTNFFRDLQTAGIKMEATEAKGMQAQVARDLPASMRAVWRGERGKEAEGDFGKYADEWRHAGGKTGWIDARTDIESQVKELESLIKSKKKGRSKTAAIYRGVKGFMEDANSAVENGVRLSTYVNARRRGVSPEDAASLSKNLTVNFNRKGAAGPAMNAAYLFYNAGVQGSANVLGSLKSKRVQALVTGLVVGGFANAMLQREIGGEDEDGVPYWDKIGEWEKERNFIVMNPFSDEGDYFKIPLPYGYNIFKVLGETSADAIAREDFDALGAAGSVAKAAIGSFNPVGSDSTFLQVIAPTLADPFAQVAENTTFYGSPLMPENRYGADKADAELYFRSVRPASKAVAKGLNELTGGTTYRSGMIDVSPETLDLAWDFMTGGLGRAAGDALGLVTSLAQGDEVKTRRIPFVRRFYAAEPETWTPQTYFEYKQDISAFEAEAKQAAKGKEDMEPYRQDPRAKLIPALKAVERSLRVAYKGREKLEAAQPEGWEEKVEMVEEKIEYARKRFIMKYREVMYPGD